jgi:hypothetical protein
VDGAAACVDVPLKAAMGSWPASAASFMRFPAAFAPRIWYARPSGVLEP